MSASNQEFKPAKPVMRHTRWFRDRRPRILASGWFEVEEKYCPPNAFGYMRLGLLGPNLNVMVSGHMDESGKRWLNASCTAYDRRPTLEDFEEVRDIFMGEHTLALIYLPPKGETTDPAQAKVLTLSCCLDIQPFAEEEEASSSPIITLN